MGMRCSKVCSFLLITPPGDTIEADDVRERSTGPILHV